MRVTRWRIEPRWSVHRRLGNLVALLEVLGVDRTAVDRLAIADRAQRFLREAGGPLELAGGRMRAARCMKSAQIGSA